MSNPPDATSPAPPDAPRPDDLAGQLLGHWRSVLQLDRLEAGDNVFTVGADSLEVTQFVYRVNQAQGRAITVADVFAEPTAAGLARRLTGGQGGQIAVGSVRSERSYQAPLSSAQERMWFLEQFEPGSTAYLVPVAAWLTGPLRHDALRAALTGIASRHDSLRTRFPAGEGQPVQRIEADAAVEFAVVDLGHLPEAQREGEALAQATAAAKRTFDIGRGPLWRTLLIRLDDRRHLLLLNFHHLIVDGRSFPIFCTELSELYRAQTTGLPRPPLFQYADFVAWHRTWLESPESARQLAYWTRQLADLETVELASDRPRPRVSSSRGARVEVAIPDRLMQALHDHSAGQQTTLFTLLLAGFATLVRRYTGATDLPIAIPIANRGQQEFAGIIGLFVNTVIIRVGGDDELTFADLVRRIHALATEAHAHAELPFEKVVQAARATAGDMPAGFTQVMFDFQNKTTLRLDIPAVEAQFINLDNGSSTFDLVLSVHLRDQASSLSVRYATDLFDEATARRLLEHYQVLLAGVVTAPDARLWQLPLLGRDELRRVSEEWNATAVPFPTTLCVHELFAAQVAKMPEAVALIFGETRYTYRELDARANRLARHLADLGAGPERLVGIFLDRSAELVVAIIAALKAGSGYVPFDRKMTRERVAFMAADAGLKLVVSELEHAGLFAGGAAVVVPQRDAARIAGCSGEDLGRTATADNIAYVIYTSGSTGAPKGVVIEHRSAVNAILATIERYRFLTVDRTLFQSSVTFDSSVSKIFQSICNGGTLVVAPEDAEFDQVLELTSRYGIPRLTTTPSELAILNEMPERMHPGIQIIGAAGENLSPSDVDRILERVPILNIYGPTETTISTTSFRLTKGAFTAAGTVPIGKPIMNYQVYVLDRHLQPQPIGCIGELCISGVGLARGYLGAPELTAQKFVAHPLRPGERLYRSGDLARWLPDGNLEFRGRIDQQVKIRGYRIELGEIEHALGRHPAVRQAVVVARQAKPAGTYLTAYLVLSPGADTPLETFRDFLGETLPDYMVPARFMRLEEFPRMVSGKIDRKALPEPDWSKRTMAREATPPRNHREETLVGIWAQVLGVKGVGIHDNFFELGGDSILSLQIIARANQVGLKVTLRQLFQERTIARLAEAAGVAGPGTAEQGRIGGPVPLTPIQRWFFARDFKHPEHWNMALWLDARTPIDRAALGHAVNAVVDHHDALRLRFAGDAGGWRQQHSDDRRPTAVVEVDLTGLGAPEQAAALELVAARLQSSLDLAGPLLRFVLAALGGGHSSLLVVAHHLVIDGVSWRVLIDDLHAAYLAAAAGREARLPAKTQSFKSWAERLVAHAASATVAAEADYWLAAVPASVPRLPRDTAGDNRVGDVRNEVSSLDRDDTAALLQEVPAALHTRINEVLLTALAQTLASWSGEMALLVELEGHGREELFADADVSRTVGWFTTMFPVWLDLRGLDGLDAALSLVKERLRAIPNHGIGYGLLRHLAPASAVAQRLAAQPAAEVVFNYLGQFEPGASADVTFAWSDRPVGPTRHPEERRAHLFDINGKVLAGRLTFTWTYNGQLHRQATVAALAKAFSERLRALIAFSRTAQPVTLSPTDFPMAGLDQGRLDKLLAKVIQRKPQ